MQWKKTIDSKFKKVFDVNSKQDPQDADSELYEDVKSPEDKLGQSPITDDFSQKDDAQPEGSVSSALNEENVSEESTNIDEKLKNISETIGQVLEEINNIKSTDISEYLIAKDAVSALTRSIQRATEETRRETLVRVLKDFAYCNEFALKTIRETREIYGFTEEVQKALDYIEGISFEMENVLIRWDVTPFEFDTFTSGSMKVTKVVPTDDELLDMKVKQTIFRGYMLGESVLIPQDVTIYRYARREQPTSNEDGKA